MYNEKAWNSALTYYKIQYILPPLLLLLHLHISLNSFIFNHVSSIFLVHDSGWVIIEDKVSVQILSSSSRLILMFLCGGTSGELRPQVSAVLLTSPGRFERRTWALWSVDLSLCQPGALWACSLPSSQAWPCGPGGRLEFVQLLHDGVDDKPTVLEV